MPVGLNEFLGLPQRTRTENLLTGGRLATMRNQNMLAQDARDMARREEERALDKWNAEKQEKAVKILESITKDLPGNPDLLAQELTRRIDMYEPQLRSLSNNRWHTEGAIQALRSLTKMPKDQLFKMMRSEMEPYKDITKAEQDAAAQVEQDRAVEAHRRKKEAEAQVRQDYPDTDEQERLRVRREEIKYWQEKLALEREKMNRGEPVPATV